MTFVIAEPCIDVRDRACVDECPVDCSTAAKLASRLGSVDQRIWCGP